MTKHFTTDELLVVADILRTMLDEAQVTNAQLLQRIVELETVLSEHNIPIPDYDIRHNELPPV